MWLLQKKGEFPPPSECVERLHCGQFEDVWTSFFVGGAQCIHSTDPQTSSGCNQYVRVESMKTIIPIILRKGRLEQVSSIKMGEEKFNSNPINFLLIKCMRF